MLIGAVIGIICAFGGSICIIAGTSSSGDSDSRYFPPSDSSNTASSFVANNVNVSSSKVLSGASGSQRNNSERLRQTIARDSREEKDQPQMNENNQPQIEEQPQMNENDYERREKELLGAIQKKVQDTYDRIGNKMVLDYYAGRLFHNSYLGEDGNLIYATLDELRAMIPYSEGFSLVMSIGNLKKQYIDVRDSLVHTDNEALRKWLNELVIKMCDFFSIGISDWFEAILFMGIRTQMSAERIAKCAEFDTYERNCNEIAQASGNLYEHLNAFESIAEAEKCHNDKIESVIAVSNDLKNTYFKLKELARDCQFIVEGHSIEELENKREEWENERLEDVKRKQREQMEAENAALGEEEAKRQEEFNKLPLDQQTVLKYFKDLNKDDEVARKMVWNNMFNECIQYIQTLSKTSSNQGVQIDTLEQAKNELLVHINAVSQKDLKKAFLRLLSILHPDRAHGDYAKKISQLAYKAVLDLRSKVDALFELGLGPVEFEAKVSRLFPNILPKKQLIRAIEDYRGGN